MSDAEELRRSKEEIKKLKEGIKKNKTLQTGLWIGTLFGAVIGADDLIFQPGRTRNAQIKAIASAPADILKGDIQSPELKKEEIAEILVDDEPAKKRWDQAKTAIVDIDELVDQKLKNRSRRMDEWTKKALRPPVVNER